MDATPVQTNTNTDLDFTEFVNETRKKYKGRNGRRESKNYIPPHEVDGYWPEPKIRTALKTYKPRLVGDPHTIKTQYLLIFSTLVYIGKCSWISHFMRYRLSDNWFPLETRPEPALKGPIYDDLWNKLYRAQWMFFPLVFRGRFELTNVRLTPDHVLPFQEEQVLKRGDAAQISLIQIDESCNESDQIQNKVPCVVVLKTYTDEKFRNQYNRELAALTVLQDQKNDNIIKYYGSFSQNGTFNLLLEYADGGGDLLAFFKENPPPQTPEDTRLFWTGIFDVLKGLHAVHQLTPDNGEPGQYRGIHEDIKPDNILLTKGRSGNLYDFSCVLTDFGYSHVRAGPDGLGIDRHGNHIYGAPEASHHHAYLQKGINRISSAADIFSAGCVISDAACWVAFGWGGRDDYYALRVKASKFDDKGHRGCFHDGTERLKVVDVVHTLIRQKCGSYDTLTPQVLGLVEQHMLVRAQNRFDAKEMFDKLTQILNQPEEELRLSTEEQIDELDSLMEQLNTRSPAGPSRHEYKHGRFLSNGSVTSSNQDVFAIVGSPTSFATPDQNSSAPTTPVRPQLSSSPITTSGGSNPHTYSTPNSPDYLSPTSPLSPPSFSPKFSRPNLPNMDSLGSASSNTGGRRQITMEQADEWCRARKGSNSATTHETDRILQRLRTQLNDRDFLFFVDDSSTMQQYKQSIESIFYTLGYISKSIDNNGIELAFASKVKDDPPTHKHSHVTPLLHILEACKYDQDGLFMEKSLGDLVDRVIIPRLFPGGTERRLSFSFLRKSKPISIFVFTDGCWGADPFAACGVEQPIRKLMKTCQDRQFPRPHVSIQFLRFGDDVNGIKHLQYLDDFGKREGYDVVDTRSVTDDVYNMFSASISQSHDDHKNDEASPT